MQKNASGANLSIQQTGNMKKTLIIINVFLLAAATFSAEPDFMDIAPKNATPPNLKPDEKVDSILASVNGIPVSLMDVIYDSRREESKLCLVYNGNDLYQEVHKMRKKVLSDIINRYLVLADYDKKKFEIPDQYIESLIDDLAISYGCATRHELEAKAKKVGSSLEELRKKAKEKIALQVMINNYYYASVNLTPKELFEYYEQHKSEFSTPAKLKIELLMLKKNHEKYDQALQQIKEELKSSNKKTFTALVKLYSDGPNAAAGGDLGWIDEPRLRPEFAQALKALKAGDVTGAIDTDEGTYFLRLDQYEPGVTASYQKLNGELRDKVESKLKETAYAEYIEKLKKDAIIRYYY